jgi:hypothetical protein
MVARARRGDLSAQSELRDFFRRPGRLEACGGNLARDAMHELVHLYAGKDLVLAEAIKQKLHELRDSLLREYENPTTAETLLIDRVVACWLHLHHLEVCYGGNPDLKVLDCNYFEKAISAAQHRYFAAIELLGRQRAVVMPPVQINLAEKQVNVAGGVTAPAAPYEPTETPAPLG